MSASASPPSSSPGTRSNNRLEPYVLSLLSRRWYEDALDALGGGHHSGSPSGSGSSSGRAFRPGDGSLAEAVFRRMWEDEQRGRNEAGRSADQDEKGTIGVERAKRRMRAPWEEEADREEPPSSSPTPPPADAAKIAGASLLAAARQELGSGGSSSAAVSGGGSVGVRRALRFTPHASRSRPQPSPAVAADSDDDPLRSLPSFLRLVSTGPSTSLPPSQYRRLRSLYRRLCDVYGVEPRCVPFHARFLQCGHGDGGHGGGGGEEMAGLGEDADRVVRSVVYALSTAAARSGDVDALDALLGPSMSRGDGSDNDNDGDDARWLPLPDRLAVLDELPATIDPQSYAHLLPSTSHPGGLSQDDARLIESWYELRTMEVVRLTGDARLALELCHAGLERTESEGGLGGGDGGHQQQRGLRRIRDEWVRRLAESEGGTTTTSYSSAYGGGGATSGPSASLRSPVGASSTAVSGAATASYAVSSSSSPASSNGGRGGGSSWLPAPLDGRATAPPSAAAPSTPAHDDPHTHDADAHSPAAARNLRTQLTAERQRSAELCRRVVDLTDTVHGLEEETCLAQEELGRAREELSSPLRPKSPPQSHQQENGSGAAAPYDDDEEEIGSAEERYDHDDIEEEDDARARLEQEGFERTIHALEGALRLETTKRAEAETALEELSLQRRESSSLQADAKREHKQPAQNGTAGPGNTNTTQHQHHPRAVCLDQETLRDLSTQAAAILGRLSPPHSSTAPLSVEMHDFHDLLSSFVDDHAAETDLDGDDDDANGNGGGAGGAAGGGDEATMAVKDVLWFMNELGWRFDSIRGRYGTEGEGVREFLGNLARALEGASAAGLGAAHQHPTADDSAFQGTPQMVAADEDAEEKARRTEEAQRQREREQNEAGLLRGKVEELEAEVAKLKKEAARVASAGRTLAAAAEDVMASQPSSPSPSPPHQQDATAGRASPPRTAAASPAVSPVASPASSQSSTASASSPAADRSALASLASRLASLQASHRASERSHLAGIAALRRDLSAKASEAALLQSRLNELSVAADTAEEDRRRALEEADSVKRNAELGKEGDKARIKYLESALRDYGGRSPASVMPRSGSRRGSSPRPTPPPSPRGGLPSRPPSPLSLGAGGGMRSPRGTAPGSSPSPRGRPPPPPSPKPPPPPPRPSAPPAEAPRDTDDSASQQRVAGVGSERLRDEVCRLAAALESSERHRAALLEDVMVERAEHASRFGRMREMLQALGDEGGGGEGGGEGGRGGGGEEEETSGG